MKLPLELPLGLLMDRLVFIQGWLHSEHSSSIKMVLKKTERLDKIQLTAVENPQAKPTFDKIIKKLSENGRQLGFTPITPLAKLGEPGRSYHTGGTLPMKDNNDNDANKPTTENFWSDLLGRPCGFRKVHVVDSSVLPSIPSTSITFSVMANAVRIAETFDKK